MIHEIDEALRSLISAEMLSGADVSMVFDAPTRDWAARRSGPVIDLYLYDIREDLKRRERGLVNEYDDRGIVVARRLPPRYFALSYLVSAWTQRPEDEHRLLSTLLTGFLRHESLPSELLSGLIAESQLPVPMSIALPPPEDRAFSDVWSALGGELKPSLDLVVSVPLIPARAFEAGPPSESGLRATVGDMAGEFTDAPVQTKRGNRD
ncbi:uncharacterized protein DUF4255 [Streptomyces sp. SLBN-118]|uniref:DUF4255 domain-containing protein n=1 Tax=Streptomyces sp. SLBN-118 TaxID=2768454 RepID=UPI001151100C|nr:DUF4255 domain-containing protein [Streptomyces sp. SLBN-118]TQK44171.1 uncharacterized protein DUF4255 [Streptomyces sp. SLBN-118]